MDDSNYSSLNQVLPDAVGSQPEVTKSGNVENRTINSVDQAWSVCETMVSDWKKGILHAARITSKINGEKPYIQKRLKDAGQDHRTNVSTGFLATECARVVPRLFMPIKTAKYLTAASLPAQWPDGLRKSEMFRQIVTDTVRSWPKFNFYIRGLAREVGIYGFAFNTHFDRYDWRPNLLRMDKGFVPQGTELLEEPQFYEAKWSYQPHELLALLKESEETGLGEWKKDAVIQAIRNACPIPVDATYPNARVYEELIRQSTWSYTYVKGSRSIQARHLWAKEASGKVSHYVLLDQEGSGFPQPPVLDGKQNTSKADLRLLYESLDKYQSMSDASNAMVFDYGDGTVHGAWGAGHILYDLSVQVEKIRCDSMDNMRMSNKMKLVVSDGKNINDVKLNINSQWMLVSNAQFGGNTAGLTSDMNGYELLDQKLSQIAQQKIGAFVPPIPLQPSDVKAAQVNAAMAKERELQEALLENWLIQFAACFMKPVTRRLCDTASPDATAIQMQKRLVDAGITPEEINILVDDTGRHSIIEFTEYVAQQRAMFAASVQKNPLFKQDVVARVMASGVGDARFVDEIVYEEGDNSAVLAAQRQQKIENAALALGQEIEVLPQDNDWVHMTVLKPAINAVLSQGDANLAEVGLRHYAGHYSQGVDKKEIPEESINGEKAWIAAVEKQIGALRQREQIQQAHQQAVQQVQQQAQQIVQAESQSPLAPMQ